MVDNASTLAEIQNDFGGVFGAFSTSPVCSYLQKHNPTLDGYKAAQKRFKKSLAAYVVATLVLGIGDRHNDNIIMIRRDGSFFHNEFWTYFVQLQTDARRTGFTRKAASGWCTVRPQCSGLRGVC